MKLEDFMDGIVPVKYILTYNVSLVNNILSYSTRLLVTFNNIQDIMKPFVVGMNVNANSNDFNENYQVNSTHQFMI